MIIKLRKVETKKFNINFHSITFYHNENKKIAIAYIASEACNPDCGLYLKTLVQR